MNVLQSAAIFHGANLSEWTGADRLWWNGDTEDARSLIELNEEHENLEHEV